MKLLNCVFCRLGRHDWRPWQITTEQQGTLSEIHLAYHCADCGLMKYTKTTGSVDIDVFIGNEPEVSDDYPETR